MEITMQYDDILPDIYNGVENIIGNTSPSLNGKDSFGTARNTGFGFQGLTGF